ncbi:MAG: ABC transporter substrate-binding protein [Hyphomicrobiaceae bacterium]
MRRSMHVVGRTLWAILAATAISLGIARAPALAGDPDPTRWGEVLAEARGQTVYWNAWGGEPRINGYIEWVGGELARRFGVTLVHVKLGDTGEAVSRVLAEKAAGTIEGGAVDLIWINGENFAAMKRNGLLLSSWAEGLPNYALVRADRNPAVRSDFTVPVEGQESPWGRAQMVFFHDTAEMADPPRSMAALLDWARANPGRFTYPRPPDFLGSTFLKQAVIELAADRAALYRPVAEADFAAVTAPLWAFTDRLHPLMWRGGRAFPQSGAELRRLMGDSEISIGFAFNPAEASAAIANKELPDTVRSYVLEGGTIGNIHFLAIPFNAAHKAGAMVVVDFLLSPEAQARKQDPAVWGDFTVLEVAALDAADRALFDRLALGVATLTPAELGAAVPEPHPGWMEAIETEWTRRYGVQ